MTTDQIKAIQSRIGVNPDGFWGPVSTVVCKKHLRSLMPSPNPWPAADRASMIVYYGQPGDESQHVALNVEGLGIAYEGVAKKTIRCHRRIQYPLLRVFEALAKTPEGRQILSRFDGCYNNRPMRGGTSTSIHAWAAAVDFDAGNNGNLTHWPAVATMPFSVIESFAREGFLSAGAFWGRDAMHFQATL